MLRAFIAVTDRDWFEHLSNAGTLDEVNFWQPSAGNAFRAVLPGEVLFFKLHSPDNFVVGGGFFSHWTRLRVSLAWEAFGISNGAASLPEMRARIERYRRIRSAPHDDYEIGCILLQQPFFLARDHWLPVPAWQANIVRGKTYDLTVEPGNSLWRDIQDRLELTTFSNVATGEVPQPAGRYGEPVLVQPRLGQGSFKIMVADAYSRRCAVTGEKALPVLQAAHIRPYADGGDHRVDNGLLLRSDLHILFDRGYLTVTPEYRVEVSGRLKRDFDNGEEYFTRHGQQIVIPASPKWRPHRDFLVWHNERRFLGAG
jgi:putative restriction endonuclease